MSVSILDRSVLETMADADLRVFAKAPSYKTVAVDILEKRRIERYADAVEFSQKTEFDLMGYTVPLALVEFIAKSSLSLDNDNAFNNTEAFPLLAEVKQGAKAILEKVQMGYKAQGLEYDLRSEAARARVEAMLTK